MTDTHDTIEPMSTATAEELEQGEAFAARVKSELPDLPQKELDRLTDALIAAFKTVYDPEIPVDIYELGLIYTVDVDGARHADIEMTLTAPGCPVAGEMPGWVEEAALNVQGIKSAKVYLTFDPPWDMSRMSDEARLELNML